MMKVSQDAKRTAAPVQRRPWQQVGQRTPLGWLQLRRNPTRMGVAVLGIAFADLLMFAQLGIQAALFDGNTLLQSQLNADIVLMNAQARNFNLLQTFARRRLFQAKDVPGVGSVEAFYVGTVTWRNPQTRRKTELTMLGQNLHRPALRIPTVNKQLEALKLPDAVLFDRQARGDYQQVVAQIERGQTVKTEIGRRTISVVGLFPLGASFATDGTLIASQDTFLRLFPERDPGQISLGLVDVEPGSDPRVVAARLNQVLSGEVRALTHQEFVDFEYAYWARQTPIGLVFNFGTIMAFIVGIVIVFQILSTDVNEHMAEYATFKAMGYRDRYLLAIVFEQAVILALLGFGPGLGLAMLQYALIRNAAALPIYMPLSRLIMVLVLTLLMCIFSGAIATRKLQSADPADIF